MALPSSGDISFNAINVELGLTATAQVSLNDLVVRTLFGVSSGAITMSNGHGKSNRVSASYTYTTNTTNASLNITTLSGYVAGKTDVVITVNSGVYIYATSTANAGLTLTGGSAGDTVKLVVNGFILGQGGDGGAALSVGNAGGPALSLGFNTTIDMTSGTGYIAGGGGGGGGSSSPGYGGGGGGAGGGTGGSSGVYAGGAGARTGNTGGNGVGTNFGRGGGSGGGGGSQL